MILSPTLALECVRQVIAWRKVSANDKSYCNTTTFDTYKGEVWVAVRPHRKSNCFLVYKNIEQQ